ncbi:MAG: phenylalanine--tRNA ligase subunit beta [bacterium]|nr:phenylalanine--tRNA ligase subunit beta [bacterium]
MKVLYSWLKEFVNIDVPCEEIARKLTMAGLEVEELEKIGDDYLIDVSIPANRGDCHSILGIAREVSALFEAPLELPLSPTFKEIGEGIDIEVLSPELCPRYTLRFIKGVKVGPSPDWLKNRLELVGIRSINNVVDITNYVMWMLGQPLHAFDADKISGKVIVRRAYNDEEIVTLDGETRKLTVDNLVIADEKHAIAIAGVMGGEESEVSFFTKNIALESACFDHISVRGTSKSLGLRTEASIRFEKGVDIGITKFASDIATEMILKLCGGEVGKLNEFYPIEYEPNKIMFRPDRFNKRMGLSLSPREMESIFTRLGFKVEKNTDVWYITPISCRRDISLEEDLYEELVRIAGYDKIPSTLHERIIGVVSPPPAWEKRKIVRKKMNSLGFSEVITSSFIPVQFENYFKEFYQRPIETVRVINPLREEESVLRSLLSQSLLTLAINNVRWGYNDFSLFETGKVFFKNEENYVEKEHLGIVQSGRFIYSWDREVNADFFLLKGILDRLFKGELSFIPAYYSVLHPGRSANIIYNGEIVGFIGEIHPDLAKDLKLPRIYIAEIDIESFSTEFFKTGLIREPNRLPKLKRDLAIVVPEDTPSIKVIEMLKDVFEGILEKYEIFDLYKGPNIPEGTINLGFSLELRAEDRTLTQEEIEDRVEILKSRLIDVNGRLREW